MRNLIRLRISDVISSETQYFNLFFYILKNTSTKHHREDFDARIRFKKIQLS